MANERTTHDATRELSDIFGSTVQSLQGDMTAIRDDLRSLGQQVASLVNREAKSRLNQTKSSINGAVNDASERGEEALDAVREAFDSLSTEVEGSIKNNPLATIGIAIGLGFLLGAAWRR